MSDATSNGLDPDEPSTPLWLTLLGVGLFLLGGIFFLATSSPEAAPDEEAAPEPPAAAPDNGTDPPKADREHAGHGHE